MVEAILPCAMLEHLWTVLGLGSGPMISVAGLWIVLGRRRAAAARPAPARPVVDGGSERRRPGGDLAPTVEAAELQLALLFRRMRAYLRDPYDLAGSRIAGETQFEECLDLAADLSIRIGDLCGAGTPPDAAERERVRGQILQGLMLANRTGTRRGAPPPPSAARGSASRHVA